MADLASTSAVAPDGYAWWYVDGLSADGSRAVSVIGFIGSVFSPWYAWSGRRNPADHCCINVALYGRGGRWTMTDRGEAALRTSREALQVGPSRMAWDGSALTSRWTSWRCRISTGSAASSGCIPRR